MSRYRVAMDIGGTFTDFVVFDALDGRTFTGKTLSTPQDPADGVLTGLRQLLPEPAEIDFLVHGTTVGLNAFLERKGTRVLLITTAGFRDSYSIARGDRKELYALQYRKPRRLVPRHDVFEVRERLRWDGSQIEPLHEEDFAPIVRIAQEERIEAVAICFLHAYVNPAHEVRAREVLRAAVPGLSVTLSHELAREWREYERASTAVLNAYIAPIVERYLAHLQEALGQLGVRAGLHVMQSNGGVMSAIAARARPIQTLLSGPVGGSCGGARLALALGRPNLLCVDMGGTSFDVSLIIDGAPTLSNETELEGLPVLTPMVDIHTVGAGGGSYAWLEAGALRVGPHSAGADPGPVCYGRGGTQVTVTDANLFLGRLDPAYFLGGRMQLDAQAAAAAIHTLASSLHLDDVTLAEGIVSIINAKMADAIRTITVKQGIDPREYSLVAFGGAGPMHAVWLARELEIAEVIIPWSPGTFSAWGMLQTDIRHDVSQAFYRPLAGLLVASLLHAFDELEVQGHAMLEEEGVVTEGRSFTRAADMRYAGQEYSVTVPLGPEMDVQAIEQRFHDTYRARYGHATPGAPVEFVQLRLAAIGALARHPVAARGSEETDHTTVAERMVIFEGVSHPTGVLIRERLQPGAHFSGPLVIEEATATSVIPPGYTVQVDEIGNLIVRRERDQHAR